MSDSLSAKQLFSFSPESLVGTGVSEKYKIEEYIGKGGTSWVYRVRRLEDGEIFALKLLLPTLDAEQMVFVRERFQEEAYIQSRLRHPNIVRLYDVIQEGELLGLLLEWIEGEDLRHLLRQHNSPLHVEQIWQLMNPILDALHHAHQEGLVHRDLKPGNILLHRSEGNIIPKLTDFGIAKLLNEEKESETLTGMVMGTVRFSSPEQLLDSKRVDHRADIYSVGIILYVMATARLPFSGSESALIYAHVHQPPPSPLQFAPDIPIALEQLILRCLEKNPEDRFDDCLSISRALSMAVLESKYLTLGQTPSSPDEMRKTAEIMLSQSQHIITMDSANSSTSGVPLFAIAPEESLSKPPTDDLAQGPAFANTLAADVGFIAHPLPADAIPNPKATVASSHVPNRATLSMMKPLILFDVAEDEPEEDSSSKKPLKQLTLEDWGSWEDLPAVNTPPPPSISQPAASRPAALSQPPAPNKAAPPLTQSGSILPTDDELGISGQLFSENKPSALPKPTQSPHSQTSSNFTKPPEVTGRTPKNPSKHQAKPKKPPMDLFEIVRSIFWVVVLVIVGYAGYKFFFGAPDPVPPPTGPLKMVDDNEKTPVILEKKGPNKGKRKPGRWVRQYRLVSEWDKRRKKWKTVRRWKKVWREYKTKKKPESDD